MIPFIDVVLVLLIIFMITAPILQSGIEVDVPKTKTIREITEQRLVLTVDKAQRIYLGSDPVSGLDPWARKCVQDRQETGRGVPALR